MAPAEKKGDGRENICNVKVVDLHTNSIVESQLSAHNHGVSIAPGIIADRAKLHIQTYLHTTLGGKLTSQ